MSRKSARGSEKKTGFPIRPHQPSDKTGSRPVGSSKDSGIDLDQLGDLPYSYGTDTLFLVAQEPHWLFTYWDIDISRHPGGPTFLRVREGDDTLESEIEVPFETRNWYIPVKTAGACYTVEIGYHRGATWHCIARSAPVQTPADRLSDSESFACATLPLHLSFQKLMDNIQTAVQSGETLLLALARLQKEGNLTAFGGGAGPDFSADQRAVLEVLLGRELLDHLSSATGPTEEIEKRIRERLQEKLGSGAASELLAAGAWSTGESSLFSALSALSSGGAWNSATLSSWAAALTSWVTAAQAASSWNAGAESAAFAHSRWGAEALSSWLQAAAGSWLQAAQTSWSQAALSSWNQAALTSWTQAATSSWAGGSASAFGPQERAFFLHVNAEVIFYGGTDPRARVTIDGKPIPLNADGSFRYHCIFPDGKSEIPIVATSPDGVETRSAVLRFERGTQKYGGVDDTAQPPLSAPMGTKA